MTPPIGNNPMIGSMGKASWTSIANALDAADGKVDGKIDKSIWNAYAKQVGGNQIKNYITTENAEKALARYFENDENKQNIGKYFNIPEQTESTSNAGATSKNQGVQNTTKTKAAISDSTKSSDKTDVELSEINCVSDSSGKQYHMAFDDGEPRIEPDGTTWITEKIKGHSAVIDKNKVLKVVINSPNDNSWYREVPAKEENPPQKQTPPKGDSPIPAWYGAGDISKVPFGDYHRLDNNGNLSMVYDGDTRLPKQEFFRDKSGKITGYADYEYDKNGNISRKIFRNPDGSFKRYFETLSYQNNNAYVIERDASGNFVGEHMMARPEIYSKA